jgi:hypothetical protein
MSKQVQLPMPASDPDPEPDVWWGEDGIDALIWADGPPSDGPADRPVPLYASIAGDAR